jgi:thymidine kinase
LAIKPRTDNRGCVDKITNHEGVSIPATSVIKLCDIANPTFVLKDTIKCVLIDEGQFFQDLVLGCNYFVSLGLKVYVAALNGTSERTPWGSISFLIPHADRITHLTANKCSICNVNRAPFTALKDNVRKCGDVLIGGADKYMPLCRKCLRDSTNAGGDELVSPQPVGDE